MSILEAKVTDQKIEWLRLNPGGKHIVSPVVSVDDTKHEIVVEDILGFSGYPELYGPLYSSIQDTIAQFRRQGIWVVTHRGVDLDRVKVGKLSPDNLNLAETPYDFGLVFQRYSVVPRFAYLRSMDMLREEVNTDLGFSGFEVTIPYHSLRV